jgi:tetratricopeptide (TPR) repeat protein
MADDAIAEYREAIRLQPDFPPAYSFLTAALRKKGEFTEALSELRDLRDSVKAEAGESRRGHAAPDAFEITQMIERSIAEFEPLAEVERKLESVLNGQAQAASVAETLAFAQLCSQKKLHAASARFWAEAFQSDRTLADADGGRHRRHAASEAVLAGSGQGKADPPLDRAAQASLRRQALVWIQADLAAWNGFVDGDDPEALEEAQWALAVWKMDNHLDGVRDPNALAWLPEAERKAWQADWADLTGLLIRLHRAQIRLNPDDPVLHFALGNALRERGELDEAIDAFRAAIRLQPGVEPRNSLGIALAGQGKLEEAIAEFRAVIQLDPGDPRFHHNLGKALARRGTRDEAIVEYRAAIRLDPCDAESRNDLAGALREQGSLAEAVDEYRTAIRLEPDNAAGYYHLGLALRAKGELAEAIAAFREARDHTQPGSDLALLIEQALAESDQ